MLLTAVPMPGFEIPPYHVESFQTGWHCVCNKQGFNCLSFPGNPGAKFTTLENATAICAKWNSNSSTAAIEYKEFPRAAVTDIREVKYYLPVIQDEEKK